MQLCCLLGDGTSILPITPLLDASCLLRVTDAPPEYLGGLLLIAAEAGAAKHKQAHADLKAMSKELEAIVNANGMDSLRALKADASKSKENAKAARRFTLRLVTQNWENYLSNVLSGGFALWKDCYNLAREDITRKSLPGLSIRF